MSTLFTVSPRGRHAAALSFVLLAALSAPLFNQAPSIAFVKGRHETSGRG
jgi:hypothetical protein